MIMTEQKMKLQHSLMSGSQMVLDKIEKKSRDGSEMPMHEMKCMVEMMYMIADIYKDIMKANHYEKDSPTTTL